MASSEEPTPKKRKGFVFAPILKPERRAQTPRFDELVFEEAPVAPMPDKVAELLGAQDLFLLELTWRPTSLRQEIVRGASSAASAIGALTWAMGTRNCGLYRLGGAAAWAST